MFHYSQNFLPDDQFFDDLCYSQNSDSFLIPGVLDYDIGCEGDLFKAPEPIIEQTLFTLSGDDIVLPQNTFTHSESLEDDDFLINIFDEYNDIFEKETSSHSELLDYKTDDSITVNENSHHSGKFTKSVSSDSLMSVDGGQMRLISMDFNDMELNNVHGMRRVCSEGYIKPQFISDQIQETRMQKLSRYRLKKTKRNFGRKIKYACRKTLADGQLRIKGRFAKIEETNEKDSKYF